MKVKHKLKKHNKWGMSFKQKRLWNLFFLKESVSVKEKKKDKYLLKLKKKH